MKSIRIFEQPILEGLSHVNPITPMILWLPVVIYCICQTVAANSLLMGIGLFVIGLLFWTFVEYILHRFLFHFVTDSKWIKRFHFIIHGIHHEDPSDATRLVMPPIVSVTLSVPFFFLFRSILGPTLAPTLFGGFIAGYLCYDYIHFYVHHFRPKTQIGMALKRHHMIHHHDTQNTRWGVSSPLWDYVFKTL